MIDMEDSDARTPLREFGNLLREERMRRGYAVDKVADQLKITSRMVRAIEDADLSSMPHAVYARGFIRAYAKLLGIDDEEIRQACSTLKDADDETSQERLMIQPPSGGRSGGGLLGIILVIALIAGGAYWVYSSNIHLTLLGLVSSRTTEKASPALPLAEPADSAPAAPAAPSSPAGSGTATGVEPSGSSNPAPTRENGGLSQAAPASPQFSLPPIAAVPGALVPGAAPSGTSASGAPVPAAQLAQNSAPVPSDAAAPASAPANPAQGPQVQAESLTLQTGNGVGTAIVSNASGKRHQLILTALAECWVHSSADDTDTRQLSIQKGETFALSFDRKLVLKLGNAGGIRIKYDGKELPEPGKIGQVRTLVFPQAATASADDAATRD